LPLPGRGLQLRISALGPRVPRKTEQAKRMTRRYICKEKMNAAQLGGGKRPGQLVAVRKEEEFGIHFAQGGERKTTTQRSPK